MRCDALGRSVQRQSEGSLSHSPQEEGRQHALEVLEANNVPVVVVVVGRLVLSVTPTPILWAWLSGDRS